MRGIIDNRSMTLFSRSNQTLIQAYSVHDAYALALNEINDLGSLITVNEQLTSNLHNVSFTIYPTFDPEKKVQYFDKRVYCENRNLTNKIQDTEFIWYMTHNPNVEIIDQFNKNWKKYSDDGVTVNSHYGSLWRLQIHAVIKKLIFDKYTRQAIVQLYDGNMSNDMLTKDVQCTLNIGFNILPNEFGVDELHMTVNMRSNDAVYGMPIDMFCNLTLFELVYNEISFYHTGLQLGTYTHNTTSLHIYENDFMYMKEGIQMMSETRIEQKRKHPYFPPFVAYTTFWIYKPHHIFGRVKEVDFLKYMPNGHFLYSYNLINAIADQFLENGITSSVFTLEEVMRIAVKVREHNKERKINTPTDNLDEMELFEHFYQCVKYAQNVVMSNVIVTLGLLSKDVETFKVQFDNIRNFTIPTVPVMKYDVNMAIIATKPKQVNK